MADLRAQPGVVLDARVLAPFGVCDLFVRLAEEPRLYTSRWTRQILDEVRRTQVTKLRWPEPLADYWRREVTSSFPETLVTGHEHLIARCTNHEGDRHVLAAAIRASAMAIVAFNLAHFPKAALVAHAVTARSPGDYLTELYAARPDAVMRRIEDIAAVRQIESAEVLHRLAGSLPGFARHIAGDREWDL